MKIIVLHGEDNGKSYERLTKFIDEAKKRNWEIVNDVVEETPSLFGTEKLVIFRDYKKIGKKELLTAEKIPGTLVIYHSGNIPVTFIKTLPKTTKIEKFEPAKLIWKFLDTFDIKTFQNVVETEAVELVFSLIIGRIRDLYWVKVGNNSKAGWQLGRLKSQASKYSKKDLEDIINSLAKMDIDIKTGKNETKSALDLLIIKKLA